MDIARQHIEIRMYAQKMGMQKQRAILKEQIDIAINNATVQIVDDIVKRTFDGYGRPVGNGFEDNTFSLSDLQPITRKISITDFNKDRKCIYYPIPSDFYAHVSTVVYGEDVRGFDIEGIGRLVKSEKLEVTRKDYHSKSTPDSPIINIHSNCVYVYTEDILDVKEIELTYLKQPRDVSLDENISSEFEENKNMMLHINMKAVNNINAIIGNSSYEAVKNEFIKLEK